MPITPSLTRRSHADATTSLDRCSGWSGRVSFQRAKGEGPPSRHDHTLRASLLQARSGLLCHSLHRHPVHRHPQRCYFRGLLVNQRGCCCSNPPPNTNTPNPSPSLPGTMVSFRLTLWAYIWLFSLRVEHSSDACHGLGGSHEVVGHRATNGRILPLGQVQLLCVAFFCSP